MALTKRLLAINRPRDSPCDLWTCRNTALPLTHHSHGSRSSQHVGMSHETSPGLCYSRTHFCPWPAPQRPWTQSTSFGLDHYLLPYFCSSPPVPQPDRIEVSTLLLPKNVQPMNNKNKASKWLNHELSQSGKSFVALKEVSESMIFIEKMSSSEIIPHLEMSPTKSQGYKHL